MRKTMKKEVNEKPILRRSNYALNIASLVSGACLGYLHSETNNLDYQNIENALFFGPVIAKATVGAFESMGSELESFRNYKLEKQKNIENYNVIVENNSLQKGVSVGTSLFVSVATEAGVGLALASIGYGLGYASGLVKKLF